MEKIKLTPEQFARKIDHTALKSEATEKDIRALAHEAVNFNFFSVCVNPDRVPIALEVFEEQGADDVEIAAVVGFPLGANKSVVKAFETEKAINDGASEIDMVANIGRLLDRDYRYVEKDINEVLKAIPSLQILLKVIIETAALPDDLKKEAAKIVANTDAAFVKTSTGFHPKGGATVEDVFLLRSVVGDKKQIKAAGGIADLKTALAMIDAGADRLGMSKSVSVMQEFSGK